MQRRNFIQRTGITVFGAGLPASGALAQNRYAKFAGKTVTVNVPAHPHYDAMLKLLPAFTRETGIKVEVDKLAIGRLKEKQLLEMAKPQGDYDLVCYIVMWKGEYVAKNLVQPLGPLFANAAAGRPGIRHPRHHPHLPGKPGPGGRPQGLPGRARRQALRTALRRRDLGARLPARHLRQART
jgi:multiple sugar transport system substrate-binding protein